MTMSACFPFGVPAANCCFGAEVGGACERDGDCLGFLRCEAGACVGTSGCDRACKDGCCAPEAFYDGRCKDDAGCVGRRRCVDGRCLGESGCDADGPTAAGSYVLYDRACLCEPSGLPCPSVDGVGCAAPCRLWRPTADLAVCALPSDRRSWPSNDAAL